MRSAASIPVTLAALFERGCTLGRLEALTGWGYNALRHAIVSAIGAEAYRALAKRNELAGCRAAWAVRGWRPWTPEEDDLLRRWYRGRSAEWIGREISRTLQQVYVRAKYLGLRRRLRYNAPGIAEFLREKNALGFSDSEIAEAWTGVDQHSISKMRKALGLPWNGQNERWRQKIIAGARRQCERAGVKSLGEFRAKKLREFVEKSGWPKDLTCRQVQVLNLIWERGPMTRREIGEALGMKLKRRPDGRYWFPMHHNTPGHGADTSIPASLIRRGLLISLGRIVRNKPPGEKNGMGHNAVLYSLPLNISRRRPE